MRASQETFIFVRSMRCIVPLRLTTVQALITQKIDELIRITGLPSIPIHFEEIAPNQSNAIANFFYIGKHAQKIVFYTSQLNSMTLEDILDTTAHEWAHYYQLYTTGASDHGKAWQDICTNIVHCKPTAKKEIFRYPNLPDLSPLKLTPSKQAWISRASAKNVWDLALKEVMCGSHEALRVSALLSLYTSHLPALLKRLEHLASRGDKSAGFLYGYICLITNEGNERENFLQVLNAAESGNIPACFYAGQWLMEGQFCERDPKQGLSFISKCLMQHFEPAMKLFLDIYKNESNFALMKKALELELKDFEEENLLPDQPCDAFIPYL